MRWKLPPTEPACLRPEDFHRIEFQWEFIFTSFKRKYIFYRISSPQVKPIIHKNLQMHIKPTSQAINKFCAGLHLLLANVRKWLYRETFDGIKITLRVTQLAQLCVARENGNRFKCRFMGTSHENMSNLCFLWRLFRTICHYFHDNSLFIQHSL